MFRTNLISLATICLPFLTFACGYKPDCEETVEADPVAEVADAGTPAPAAPVQSESAPEASEPEVVVSEPGDGESVEEPTEPSPDVPEGPLCGDQVCNGDETTATCWLDCPAPPPVSVCNDNGVCDAGETAANCDCDCGTEEEPPVVEEVCGNGECELYETHASCAADCEAPPAECFCGDGNCDTSETPVTCSQDCGSPEPTPFCGDDACNNGETYETCSQDCEAPAVSCGNVPDVVVTSSSAQRTIWLSTYYTGGEQCIIVESDSIANNGWGSTTQLCDEDGDGYVAFTPPSSYEGTSRFTFRSPTYEQNNSYADYGLTAQREVLLCNSAESLAFVGCPWYVPATGGNNGSNAACDLYATWTANGVSGAETATQSGISMMGNYHEMNP